MLSTSAALDIHGKGFWNTKKDQLILRERRQEAQRRDPMWNGPLKMSGNSTDTKGLEWREEELVFRERVEGGRSPKGEEYEGTEKGHKGKNLVFALER